MLSFTYNLIDFSATTATIFSYFDCVAFCAMPAKTGQLRTVSGVVMYVLVYVCTCVGTLIKVNITLPE